MAMMLLISLVPLVVFAVIDYYADLKQSILGAILSAMLFGIITIYFFEDMYQEVIGIIATMIIMGIIAVKMKNEKYFKFQPVVLNLGYMLILAWFRIFDEPLIVKMIPSVLKYVDESQRQLFSQPQALEMLSSIELYLIFWIGIHSVLIAYAALRMKNIHWVLIKAIGLPLVAAGAIATNFVVSMF